MKIVILYSGGLDSFIMKKLADKAFPDAEVVCVWFDIGQEYSKKEQAVLPNFVEVRKVDWLIPNQELISKNDSKSGNIIIPGRNAVLATLAASIYLPDQIWLGALLGETHEGSTDKNFEFLKRINSMLEYVHSPYKESIKVIFPLVGLGMGKFEAVKWAIDNGSTPEELIETSSCLSGENGNCGKCVVCLRRWGIFKQLGFSEQYNTFPLTVTQNKEMIKEMIKGERGYACHYDDYRRSEIIPALKIHFSTNSLDDIERGLGL